jgi:hypothetical protein
MALGDFVADSSLTTPLQLGIWKEDYLITTVSGSTVCRALWIEGCDEIARFIISARFASSLERKNYAKEIGNK